MPAMDGADLKVVRFGNGAAILILVMIAGLAAIAVNVVLRDNVVVERRSEPATENIDVVVPPPVAEPVEAGITTVEAPPEPPELTAEERAAQEEIDKAYADLDATNTEALRAFVEKFADDTYADQRGYLYSARQALKRADAAERKGAAEEEAEEERRRLEQQKAVPWDMDVAPPAAGN